MFDIWLGGHRFGCVDILDNLLELTGALGASVFGQNALSGGVRNSLQLRIIQLQRDKNFIR